MKNNMERVNIEFVGGMLMVLPSENGKFYYDRENGEVYPDFSPNSLIYLNQAKAIYSDIINFPEDGSLITEENYIPAKITANTVSGKYEFVESGSFAKKKTEENSENMQQTNEASEIIPNRTSYDTIAEGNRIVVSDLGPIVPYVKEEEKEKTEGIKTYDTIDEGKRIVISNPGPIVPYNQQNIPEETKETAPRNREDGESNESYEAYLKDYYEKNNPQKDSTEYFEGTKIPKPRDRGIYETDEEYVKYLGEHYKKYEDLYEPKKPIQTPIEPGLPPVNPIGPTPTPVEPTQPPVDQDNPPIEVIEQRKEPNFLQKHKKAIIIGAGLAAAALLAGPVLIPSLMYANSCLWTALPNFPALQGILHGINLGLGHVIGAAYTSASGVWTASTGMAINSSFAAGTVLGHAINLAAIPFIGSKVNNWLEKRKAKKDAKNKEKKQNETKKDDVDLPEATKEDENTKEIPIVKDPVTPIKKETKNYYAILGIEDLNPAEVTNADLDAAFLKQNEIIVNSGQANNREKLFEVVQAYKFLSNPKLKAQYDAELLSNPDLNVEQEKSASKGV